MIKTKTVETVDEFDEKGVLLKRTVTETEETDDNPVRYAYTSAPHLPISCGFPPICSDRDVSGVSGNCGVM